MNTFLFEHPFNRKAFRITLLSFGIGTLLLLLFLITRNGLFAVIGIYYTLIAIIVNALTGLKLIKNLITDTTKYETLYTLLILLLNIPITVLYIHTVMFFI